MTAWIWINLISGVVAIRFGFGKLAKQRRPFYDVSAWIYTCLTFSAGLMVCEAFINGPHNWSEVLFNFSVAMYFARRLWRERRLPPPQGVSAAEAKDFLTKEKQNVEIK